MTEDFLTRIERVTRLLALSAAIMLAGNICLLVSGILFILARHR